MSLLLIDVGSSSVRALLMDEELRVLDGAIARRNYQFQQATVGASIFDALWLRQKVEDCIDQILQHPSANTIQAVGMTSFVGNLLGVHEYRQPITPLYTYADNRLGTPPTYNTASAYDRTGCPYHPAYAPARLAWLHEFQPEQYAQATYWLDFATYCYQIWFGRVVPCSYSVASWSGLFNHAELAWDTEIVDALGLDTSQLPPLADFDAVQAGLGNDYRQRWTLLADVPFYLAVGDGAVANLGSGGVSPERLILTVGTTSALRLTLPIPPARPLNGLWHYRVDGYRHLLGGATSEGGNILRWANEVLHFTPAVLAEVLKEYQPAAHGLTIVPLLAGERSLGHSLPDVSGMIHGLRLTTTAEQIAVALLESVALRFRPIADLMPLDSATPIYAGGGALAALPMWGKIFANALQRPVLVIDEAQVTARGLGALLMKAEGLAENVKSKAIFHPERNLVAALDEQAQKQAELYQKEYPNDISTGF